MSKAIKPKQGVVYECYKGFVDSGSDRVRTGQKFVWDGCTIPIRRDSNWITPGLPKDKRIGTLAKMDGKEIRRTKWTS